MIRSKGGGGSGVSIGDATAIASEIVAPKTAYIAAGKATGTITEKIGAGVQITPTDAEQIIPEGRYGGNAADGKIKAVTQGDIVASFPTAVLNTSGASAAAGDIRTGDSAYVNGVLVNGTLTPLDTSDATAGANDIILVKTAYVNGSKITGTLEIIGQRKQYIRTVPIPSIPYTHEKQKYDGKTMTVPIPTISYEAEIPA